jgi:hypothetical protein
VSCFSSLKIDCNDGITSDCETLAGGLNAEAVPADRGDLPPVNPWRASTSCRSSRGDDCRFPEKAVLRWCVPDRLVIPSTESARNLAEECPRISNGIGKVNGPVADAHFRPPRPTNAPSRANA